MDEIKLSLGLYAFVKQKTRETYLGHGGVGAGWLKPVAGEGSCDACVMTKSIYQDTYGKTEDQKTTREGVNIHEHLAA